LHTIVMIRQTHHGPTQTYTTRRIAQGKSQRDIRRCRKRTWPASSPDSWSAPLPTKPPVDEK
jgi:hypothetical protein